eukprot:SAG31_NODE_4103_length_3579_cov_2.836494_5_plen_213_part_00
MTVYPKGYNTSISFFEMSWRKPPGRSYKFYAGEPVYEFGTGMSYTSFIVTALTVSDLAEGILQGYDTTEISTTRLANVPLAYRVNVTNTGYYAGAYVALAFMSPPNSTSKGATEMADHETMAPKKVLFDFGRIFLEPSQSGTIDFLLQFSTSIDKLQMVGKKARQGIGWSSASVDATGNLVIYPGLYKVQVTDARPHFFSAVGSSIIVDSIV